MKNITLITFLLLLSLTSCKKKITEFYFTDTSQVTVASSSIINVPFNLQTPDMVTNYEQEFESNDTRKEHIKNLKLTKLKLSIINPSDYTFSWLESIEIFISSDNTPNEQRVAYKTEISDNVGMTLICNVEDLDLQEYIKDDSFSLRLKTVTDETFNSDIDIEIMSEFFVNAKIFKN